MMPKEIPRYSAMKQHAEKSPASKSEYIGPCLSTLGPLLLRQGNSVISPKARCEPCSILFGSGILSFRGFLRGVCGHVDYDGMQNHTDMHM